MKNGIKITGDRDLLKALQSRDKNAFLKYALKKTYNIDFEDGGGPLSRSPQSWVTDFAIKTAGRRPKSRSRKNNPSVKGDTWVSDKTAESLLKNPKIKKTARFGATCKTLFVRIKNIPSRFLPKKKKSSSSSQQKKRRPVTRWWRWIPHSPIWYVPSLKKRNESNNKWKGYM